MGDAPSSPPRKSMADRPLHELLSHDQVDLYVGPENTHWVLHSKLLCARSTFFRQIFSRKDANNRLTHSFGLPDDDDVAFRHFVGWLYSDTIPMPRTEGDLGVIFELYLMGYKWSVQGLTDDCVDAVRRWYWESETYPSLRRVQYIYANTEEGAEMRDFLIECVARMLVTMKGGVPKHWDKALRKNGQLAVDIILAMQRWRFGDDDIPDPRIPEEHKEGGEAKGKLEDKGMNIKVEPKEHEDLNAMNGITKEKLQKELPNGLPNGLTNGLTNGHTNGDTSE